MGQWQMSVRKGQFCSIWVKNITVKFKSGAVGPKNFIIQLIKWPCLRLRVNIFLVHTCLGKETPVVSDRVIFAQFQWAYYSFLKLKIEWVEPKNLNA